LRARGPRWGKTTFIRRGRTLIALGTATLALAGSVVSGTTRAATVVDVPPSAVVATCAPDAKVDQTAALLAFVRAHDEPGTTFRFKRDGCYWINNTINIVNAHDLTFDGNGATFKTIDAGFNTVPSDPALDRVWPRLRSMWRFAGGYNLTLRHMTILGSNGGPNAAIDPRTGQPFRWDFHCPEVEPPHPFCLEAQAGVTIFGVNSGNQGAWGARVDGVTVRYTFGFGIELHGWGEHALNRKIEVRNSKIQRTGSMALLAQNVDGAVFENNVLITPRRSMFNIEPPTPGMPSYNVVVNRNLMIDEDDPNDTKHGHFFMFANGGNPDARVENITISNNQLVNQPVNAFINLGEGPFDRHTTRRNIRIINNVSNIDHGAPFSDQAPIRAVGVVGLEVRGNTQAIQPNQRNYGVSVYGLDGATSSNIVVKDNHFANALGALYTDPAIPGAVVCNNRVGLEDQVDAACTTIAARDGIKGPKIIVPGEGSIITGGRFLSAAAPSWTTRVEYLISGGFFYLTHLGEATRTGYGWVYQWNTVGPRAFPNRDYWLKARAFDASGHFIDSPQVRVTVRN
jgi:hypothetical protein